MCYLACLAIGALILINRAVDSWTSGLAREVTVQVRPVHDANIETELGRAEAVLKDIPGIVSYAVLDRDAGGQAARTLARQAQSRRPAHSAANPRHHR